MRVLISCGEPSGDLYAGALARHIRACDPSAEIAGLGGAHLEAAGGELVADYRGLTVTGLSEAISVLPRSWAIYRRLIQVARKTRPDVFVPIDFPDFNFRLAGALQRLGIPIVYYVCPQVWAWRRRRLHTIGRLVKRALVIFPFEETIYRDAGIPVEFVGHPLVELTSDARPRREFLSGLGYDPGRPTVALLPGSRPNEVRTILPDLVRSAALVAAEVPDVQFLVARAPQLDDALFTPLAELRPPAPSAVVEGQTDNVLAAADVVVTASGTATVQTALHGRPMVIVYRLSPITYRMVRRFAHVEAAGMVNLIAGKPVVPELLQDAFTPRAVAADVLRYLGDPVRAEQTRQALDQVRRRLGSPGASRRAAEAVLAVARAARPDGRV